MSEPITRHLALKDGRNLSYSDIGTGENGTWIHCHGIPGSRNELLHLTASLKKAGIRLIVPDRPGYGRTTPDSDFSFASHSDNLQQLADHLRLTHFELSGFSGGGVFAMAAAHDLGSRVSRLTIAATPAVPLMESPFEYASQLTANTWRAALENPESLSLELEALTGSVDVLSEALLGAAGEQERHYLTSEPELPGFMKSLRTALEQGAVIAARVLARDSFLIASSWPFRLENINVPVRIVHGVQDKLVHHEHQVALSGRLQGSQSVVVSGGHYRALSSIWD